MGTGAKGWGSREELWSSLDLFSKKVHIDDFQRQIWIDLSIHSPCRPMKTFSSIVPRARLSLNPGEADMCTCAKATVWECRLSEGTCMDNGSYIRPLTS